MYGEEKPIAYLQLFLSKKRTSVILLFQMFMRKLAGNKVFVCVAAAEFLILSQMRNLQHKQNLSPLRKTMDLIYIIFLFQMFCKKYELIIVFIQYIIPQKAVSATVSAFFLYTKIEDFSPSIFVRLFKQPRILCICIIILFQSKDEWPFGFRR